MTSGQVIRALVFGASVAVVGYTVNECRHLAPDPGTPWMCNAGFCAQTHDPSFGFQAERAVCFSRHIVLRDLDDDLCSGSFTRCEELRGEELDDPAFEGVGRCRVVSAAIADRDAHERHLVYAIAAALIGGLMLAIYVANLSTWLARRRRA